jgi:hypothetical protein
LTRLWHGGRGVSGRRYGDAWRSTMLCVGASARHHATNENAMGFVFQ